MKKLLWFLGASFIMGCSPLQEKTNILYENQKDSPLKFEAISEPFEESELIFHFTPSTKEFFDKEKGPLQVSGELSITKDFSHLNTHGISFRSYRPYQAPFTFVDTNHGWKPVIIENIHEVEEIPANTGVSAFILSFDKADQNPLSGNISSEERDPLKILYYQGKFFELPYDFWIGKGAYPKVWNNDLWHLEVQEHQDDIPEYLVMKNQEQVGSFFSLPGAGSMVKSFQIDDNGWWLAYKKTTKLAGKDNFKREEAFELNGEDLLKPNGWIKIYGLQKIKNQIFFFFKDQKGNIGYQLGDERYATAFEDILDEGCCAVPEITATPAGKLRFVAKTNGLLQEFEGRFK